MSSVHAYEIILHLFIYDCYATLTLKLRSQEMLLFASIEVREDKNKDSGSILWESVGHHFRSDGHLVPPNPLVCGIVRGSAELPSSQDSYISSSIHDEGASSLVRRVLWFSSASSYNGSENTVK
jgi:hypothetical protein